MSNIEKGVLYGTAALAAITMVVLGQRSKLIADRLSFLNSYVDAVAKHAALPGYGHFDNEKDNAYSAMIHAGSSSYFINPFKAEFMRDEA